MSLWIRLLQALGFDASAKRTFYLDEELAKSLQFLAWQEHRTVDEIAAEILTDAFSRRYLQSEIVHRWYSLSEREQQVAMMICYNKTTAEIAKQLGVSENTIKTHVHNILEKFGVGRRTELRMLLSVFEFYEYESKQSKPVKRIIHK